MAEERYGLLPEIDEQTALELEMEVLRFSKLMEADSEKAPPRGVRPHGSRIPLNKRLQGDVYEIFYENPHGFYQALRDFFGSGVDAVLRIIAQRLIEEGHLEVSNPREFVEVLKSPGGGGRELWKMLKLQEGGET